MTLHDRIPVESAILLSAFPSRKARLNYNCNHCKKEIKPGDQCFRFDLLHRYLHADNRACLRVLLLREGFRVRDDVNDAIWQGVQCSSEYNSWGAVAFCPKCGKFLVLYMDNEQSWYHCDCGWTNKERR